VFCAFGRLWHVTASSRLAASRPCPLGHCAAPDSSTSDLAAICTCWNIANTAVGAPSPRFLSNHSSSHLHCPSLQRAPGGLTDWTGKAVNAPAWTTPLPSVPLTISCTLSRAFLVLSMSISLFQARSGWFSLSYLCCRSEEISVTAISGGRNCI
jgi:hypothetical protein